MRKEKIKKVGKTIFFGALAIIGAWGVASTLNEKSYASGEIDVKEIPQEEE